MKKIATNGNGQALLSGETTRATEAQGLKAWALVELYGHQRIVGQVTVDPVEFPGMIRVDVPDLLKNGETSRKGFTRYIGRGAVYSCTPVDEQTIREMLPHVDGLPARQAQIRGYDDHF